MNKKLIAVAIGAALSGSAFAQSSNVTLYGRINTAIESNQTGSAGSEVRMQSYSSRLGVRGTEDLGGGLNGVFGIETQLASDSGAGGLGTNLRNAYIGVDSKNLGRLTLGRLDAAVGLGSAPLYQQVTAVIDLIGFDTGAGAFINAAPVNEPTNDVLPAPSTLPAPSITGVAANRAQWATQGGNTINVQQRASNALSYGIKSGDFTVGARLQLAGLDGGTGAKTSSNVSATNPVGSAATGGENNVRLLELAGTYTSGPLTLGAGYETQSSGKAEETVTATQTSTGTITAPLSVRFDNRIQAVAGYNVSKDLKVGASFARNNIEAQPGTTLQKDSGNEFALSATYALDPKNSVVLNYGSRDRIAATAAVTASSTTPAFTVGQRDDGKRKQFAIGYRYDFSKRTQGYALYNRTDPNSTANNDEIKSFIVGLRHNF